MSAPAAYQRRVIAQGRAWVGGESRHNHIDDECCPDFSCCMPELFEKDRAKRAATYNAWALAHGLPPYRDA